RGTPAAAFAMYCNRNVLVDTELLDYTRISVSTRKMLLREGRARVARDPDVLVDRPGNARVLPAAAADRRAQVDHVRLRLVRVAVGGFVRRVDHAPGRAVLAHFKSGEARAPRGLPEIPALVAESDAGPEPVVDGIFLAAVPVDDPERHGAG